MKPPLINKGTDHSMIPSLIIVSMNLSLIIPIAPYKISM
jgi:hypothetical protein